MEEGGRLPANTEQFLQLRTESCRMVEFWYAICIYFTLTLHDAFIGKKKVPHSSTEKVGRVVSPNLLNFFASPRRREDGVLSDLGAGSGVQEPQGNTGRNSRGGERGPPPGEPDPTRGLGAEVQGDSAQHTTGKPVREPGLPGGGLASSPRRSGAELGSAVGDPEGAGARGAELRAEAAAAIQEGLRGLLRQTDWRLSEPVTLTSRVGPARRLERASWRPTGDRPALPGAGSPGRDAR